MATITWLTPRQVSACTGYSLKTLSNWRYMRPNPGPRCIKVGGQWRYPADDFEAWQAKHMAAV